MSPDDLPGDLLGVGGVIGDEAAADLVAVGAAHHHRIAARELALDPASRRPAAGSCPRRSAATAPSSTTSVPVGSSEPAIHFLRAVTGLPGVEEPGGAARRRRSPAADARCGPRRSPCAVPPAVAILPASILVCMPPRDSSEPAPPGHRLDLRRDALDHRNAAWRRSRGRAAPCRARRRRRAAPAGRRSPWWRRARPGGRCRRSGFRWSRPCRSR